MISPLSLIAIFYIAIIFLYRDGHDNRLGTVSHEILQSSLACGGLHRWWVQCLIPSTDPLKPPVSALNTLTYPPFPGLVPKGGASPGSEHATDNNTNELNFFYSIFLQNLPRLRFALDKFT